MHSNGKDCFPNFWPLFLSLIMFWWSAIFIDYFIPAVQLLNQKGIFPLGSTHVGFAWKTSCPWWPGSRGILELGVGAAEGTLALCWLPTAWSGHIPHTQGHAVGVTSGSNLLRTQGNEESSLIFGRYWRGGPVWAVPSPYSMVTRRRGISITQGFCPHQQIYDAIYI